MKEYGECKSCIYCSGSGSFTCTKYNKPLIVSVNTCHKGLMMRPYECARLEGFKERPND